MFLINLILFVLFKEQLPVGFILKRHLKVHPTATFAMLVCI